MIIWYFITLRLRTTVKIMRRHTNGALKHVTIIFIIIMRMKIVIEHATV